ncbi:MAG: LLM class flavin-dependent oxidoreductase [Candidatus Caldarchaeum sp.]
MNVSFSVEVVPKDPLWKLSMASVLIERHGFDGIWVSDHFFNRNCFITLATLSRYTRRILLGPAVVNPYVVHPVLMAQNAATLWELCPGRVRFAVGAGDASSLKQLGFVREKPVEKVVKAVETMREYLTKLDTYKIPDLKIYVGAQSPRMMEAASVVADGVLVNWSNLEMLRNSLKHIASEGKKAFAKAAYVITSVHDDIEKAWKTAVPYAAYLMTGASEKHLEKAGVTDEHREEVEKLLATRQWHELYHVAKDDWVKFFSFYGKPSQLEGFVSEALAMGYGEIVFAGPLGPRYLKALKNIASICRSVRRRR